MSIRGIVALTGLASLMACSALVPPPPVPSGGHLRVEDNRQTQDIPPVVDKVPLLPRPEPAPDLEKYTVVVNEVPVKELLFALARDAQVNVDIDPGIEGIVTLNAIDQTLPQILDRIARQADVRFEIQGKNIIVSPDRPYLRTYRVDYVNLTRESKGTIDVATQISTTGMSDIGGGGAGGGGSNNSTSSITNTANNRFWLTLTRNIQALVGETAAGSAAGQGDLPVTESVIPNPESGIITVRATSKQHAAVQSFLDKVLANAQRQVLVEATVVEVILNDQYQQGIDWSVIQNDGSGFQFDPNLQALSSNVPQAAAASFILGYLDLDASGKNIDIAVQLLRTFGDIKVLSSPKIMTLNNQTAVLKVVQNFVYFEVDVEPGSVSLAAVTDPVVDTTAKTVPVGLVMTVTPQINENDAVTLNVRPTISTVIDTVADPNPELSRDLDTPLQNLVPVIQVREMESVLQINNGQIAVLGGLMQDSVEQDSNSIPLLSDIPLLGDSLFRSRSNAYEKSELVIFLRPLVIRNPSLEGDLAGYRSYLEERVESNTLY
ncbi:MAG: pilus (MSHA type) biogenesis protein MshL [Pseudomonadota bacterium]|nr:pilus (MSHA type) biogenesis protein MshL [Pseudomonadota bacterium]